MARPILEREKCDVCARTWFRHLMQPCEHSPEEHAEAAVRRIRPLIARTAALTVAALSPKNTESEHD